ncbi:hypothetical protein Emed_007598 [Eimeria media]
MTRSPVASELSSSADLELRRVGVSETCKMEKEERASEVGGISGTAKPSVCASSCRTVSQRWMSRALV